MLHGLGQDPGRPAGSSWHGHSACLLCWLQSWACRDPACCHWAHFWRGLPVPMYLTGWEVPELQCYLPPGATGCRTVAHPCVQASAQVWPIAVFCAGGHSHPLRACSCPLPLCLPPPALLWVMISRPKLAARSSARLPGGSLGAAQSLGLLPLLSVPLPLDASPSWRSPARDAGPAGSRLHRMLVSVTPRPGLHRTCATQPLAEAGHTGMLGVLPAGGWTSWAWLSVCP